MHGLTEVVKSRAVRAQSQQWFDMLIGSFIILNSVVIGGAIPSTALISLQKLDEL